LTVGIAADQVVHRIVPIEGFRPGSHAVGDAVTAPQRPGGKPGEAYLPTQCAASSQEARLSQPHGDQGRPCRAARAPAEGAHPPVGVIQSIQRRDTFEMLRQHGRRVRSGALAALCLGDAALAELTDDPPVPGSPGDPFASVAYAIGRQAGGAVQRNRCRRRLRAIITQLDHDGAVPPGAYLIRVSAPALQLDYPELSRCAAGLFERVGAS
jgi:ribonuclease P protein component